MVLIVILFLWIWYHSCISEYVSTWNALTGLINCLAAVANAGLLYATLAYQGKSFRKERFETTLFNIIENHRNFVNGIKFKAYTYDHNGNSNLEDINCENLFIFSHKEINEIVKILQANQYPNLSEGDYQNKLNEISNQKESAGDAITMEELNEKENFFRSLFELSWRCKNYKICEEKWKRIKEDLHLVCKEDEKKIAYKIFFEKWKLHYRPYIRSLKLILLHIYNSENPREEKIRYFKYVTSQMTNFEQFFIKCHCTYDEEFRRMFDFLTDNVTTN